MTSETTTMRPLTALVAALATTSSAFLVPPSAPNDFTDTTVRGGRPEHFKEFVHAVLAQQTTTIDLACSSCPFPVAPTDHQDGPSRSTWEYGVDSVIQLEFDTHDHTFNVNGHPLLPLEKAQRAQSTAIKAYQVRKDKQGESVEVPIQIAMEVMPLISSPHRDGVTLLPVDFTVLGVDGIAVKVNTISLKLVQPPNGDLVIVHAEQIPFADSPGAEECEGAARWSICRIQAMITSRVKSLMYATRKKSHKIQTWLTGQKKTCGMGRPPHGFWKHPRPDEHGDHPHRHRWGSHHGHHWHHRHHRYHRLGHILHQTFRFFVVPALLGIVGGLAASAIGMLLGQLIVFIWLRVYRRNQRGPLRVEREAVVSGDEKDGLLDDVEVLPAYHDARTDQEAVEMDADDGGLSKQHEKH